MKVMGLHKSYIAAIATVALSLSACTSDQVINNTVGVAAGTTKVVAKGAVGAGKLAYRGVAGGDDN